MGVSENVVYPIVPNGFDDHYPYEKWWKIGISLGILTQHFQTNPHVEWAIKIWDLDMTSISQPHSPSLA